MRTIEILAAGLFLASISATSGAEPGATLETIEPDTALAEIQQSRGVVLLDVYAEW
jgi:hypothetical protein